MSSPSPDPVGSVPPAAAAGPDPGDVAEVAVSGPDEAALATLTRTLVEERLVACGQISPVIRSVYRWEGEVCDEPEARVVLHTRTALIDAVAARVRELHPYDVPCVLGMPACGGDPDYLAWVVASTLEPGSTRPPPGG